MRGLLRDLRVIFLKQFNGDGVPLIIIYKDLLYMGKAQWMVLADKKFIA